jgi:hypothetical protein
MSLVAAGGAASLLPKGLVAQTKQPRFLIVLTGSGGASLIDSVLAIRESESANASTINAYPDAMVQNIADSPFRAIDSSGTSVGAIPVPYTAVQSEFVRKHKQDMMVVTHTGTSVNHGIAQKRAVTGNEAWAGRTLQELVALEYGDGYAIPNVAMVTGTAYIERGNDKSIPSWCFGEIVAQPALWPLALHGSRGLDVPDRRFIEMARRIRNEKLDPESRFARIFRSSPKLEVWRSQRELTSRLETEDLITKLMLFSDSAEYPLSAHGLSESPTGAQVRAKFPKFDQDPLEAQAALAFLLLKNRVSVTVTIGPSFNAVLADGATLQGQQGLKEGDLINPPIAFDFSHQSHRATQALMWSRLMKIADGLIDLLKSEELEDGVSFWDRTMIYLASDFGREKRRPAGATDFGTSHDLNNGVMVLSPLVRGNTVLGGVDKDTALTYGFDLRTGAPDPGRTTAEAELFAGLVQALGIDTGGTGLPDVPAMRKI